MIYVLIVLLIIVTCWAGIASFFAIKFGMTLLKFQDVLEVSLGVIDDRVDSINEILKTPLFYDSPQVRQVLKDIEETRNQLIDIAMAMSADIQLEGALSIENEKDGDS